MTRHREIVLYGWMFFVSLGVAVTLAALFIEIGHRRHNQQVTNHAICSAENTVINYLHAFNTSTPTQLRLERRQIDRTLVRPKDQQLRRFLDVLIDAELATPSLSQLHPFTLATLPCPPV